MTAAVARVVFDTNILLSGHFWKGPRYRCLLAAEASLAALVLSDPIVSELREKLTDKFALPAAEADAIIDRLSTHAERVRVQGRSGWVPQDPDDDKFIDTARSGGAAIIVSGDRHLLALGNVEGSRSSRRDSSSIVWLPSVQRSLESQCDRWEGSARRQPVARRSERSSCGSDVARQGCPPPSALRGLDPRHALPLTRHLSERRTAAVSAKWAMESQLPPSPTRSGTPSV